MLGFTLVVLAFAAADATPGCRNVPAAVQLYLSSAPGWAVLKESDLVLDDQQLWEKMHGGCPGIAEGDFDGSGNRGYAVAFIRRPADGKRQERLVLIRTGRQTSSSNVLAEFKITISSVVWAVPPGHATDLRTGRKVYIPHDSFVLEEMESTSTLYYLKGGKLKTLLQSE